MNIIFETYFDINSRAKFSSRTTRKNFIDNLKLNENVGGEAGETITSDITSDITNEISITSIKMHVIVRNL